MAVMKCPSLVLKAPDLTKRKDELDQCWQWSRPPRNLYEIEGIINHRDSVVTWLLGVLHTIPLREQLGSIQMKSYGHRHITHLARSAGQHAVLASEGLHQVGLSFPLHQLSCSNRRPELLSYF